MPGLPKIIFPQQLLEEWNAKQLSFKRGLWQEESVQHGQVSEETGSGWMS